MPFVLFVADSCRPWATWSITNKNRPSTRDLSRSHSRVCQPQATNNAISPQKPQLDHWHTGCKPHPRPRSNRIASLVELTNLMKAKVTTNLTSVVMLAVLTPFLALAILVSIQTAGIRNNDVLLLLLTLSSAVLSGINGFGRRTPKAVPFSTAKTSSDTRLHLSARSSNNA